MCKGSVAGILHSVDRYDDCVGLEPDGESHFRFSITEGNAVLPGKKNSEFALKVERLRKGVTYVYLISCTIKKHDADSDIAFMPPHG